MGVGSCVVADPVLYALKIPGGQNCRPRSRICFVLAVSTLSSGTAAAHLLPVALGGFDE
jgi:hypothetical protein